MIAKSKKGGGAGASEIYGADQIAAPIVCICLALKYELSRN
jgi:hypothetical protein